MSQLLSKVNCHILQFLHCFTLLLDDVLKPTTPLTNGTISEML